MDDANNFKYCKYSVPKHDPVIDPDTDAVKITLTKALDAQIKPVNVVLVIAGMYASYRYCIQKEIEIAQKYDKPIISLVPWGQERTPTNVQDAALEMVNWNTSSIVSAIRTYAIEQC